MPRRNNRNKKEYQRRLGFNPHKYLSNPASRGRQSEGRWTEQSQPFRGDIWFAYLGEHYGAYVIEGCRPVLVISNNEGNYRGETITVIPITRNTSRLYLPTQMEMEPEDMARVVEGNPDIIVGDVNELTDGKTNYAFDIEVLNHEKFVALDRVMPEVVEFGDVTLGITLYDEENSVSTEDGIDIFTTIFKDNPLVEDVKDVVDFTGTRHGFVRFKPRVVQFFDDDISDFNGNWSGLAQDIAREVFGDGLRSVHFCTAAVNATGVDGKVV